MTAARSVPRRRRRVAWIRPAFAIGRQPGPTTKVIGTLQATEAIKLVPSVGELLLDRLLLFDALPLRFREVRLQRRAGCAVCGR